MARRKARKVGLPEEIIVDILIQLPPKSIGQFRCVSKQWCSLLSDPKFLKAHHNIHAHKQQQTKLIFISPSHSLHTITFKPQNEYQLVGISRKLNFHQLSTKCHIIVGSCNGLVLVVDKQYIKFLINPTTLKYHQIPNFELAPPKPDEYGMCGLGYDSATDDYKIVALSRSYTSGVKTTFVDIYSVKKGFWRRLESSGFDDTHYPLIASGLLLNGALHWVADKTNCCRSVIVAFDLSGETFLELRTPECYEGVEFLHNLVVLRGCLCMVTDSEENKLDVLMMTDYGVEESWTKFSFTIPEMFIRPLPMCLTSEDDVVLNVVDGGKLIVYNIKEDQWWYMMVDEINLKYKSAGILIDSLVSPTFGKGTEGYFIA